MVNHANEAVSQQPDHPNNKKHIIIADSGTTAHYGTSELPVLNKVPCTKEICIRTANGAIMKATHEAKLDIPALPISARHIYIVPDLADRTLLSLSQLCKANCQVVFDNRTVTVHHNGKTVVKGGMHDGTALWKMEMPSKRDDVLEFTANTAIYFNTAAEIVKFMHTALGYPTLATLDKALANKAMQEPTRTPTTRTQWTESNNAMQRCSDPSERSTRTEEFVCQSIAKNKYVYIFYEYTSNHIFAEPIQSTSDKDITEAFKKCMQTLKKANITPELHLIDNQCGKLQIAALEKYGIKYQIVPPGIRRRNTAERAIRTFKDHFLSILCGTDDAFPLRIWAHTQSPASVTA
jgi:hypothetical protein